METEQDKSRSIASAHGAFALFVLMLLLIGCLIWPGFLHAVPSHPWFPRFVIGQSQAGIEVTDWQGRASKGKDVVIFFQRGSEVALPFKVWERKQWVGDVNPSMPYSAATVEQAIADFVRANTECDWTLRGLGPPPTFANSTVSGSLATAPRSKFYVGGLFASLALWAAIVLAVRSAFKWINRPRVTVGNLCAQCKYDLSGLPAVASDGGSEAGVGSGVGVCPECGCPRVVPSPP